MTTHDHPPVLDMLHDHPTSPPMTPGIHDRPHFLPQPAQTPPLYKRMGIPKFAHTPPLEFTPIGQGHFKFTRAQSLGPSSRPSSVSGRAYAGTTPQETEYEDLSDDLDDSDDPNDSDNSDLDDSSEASDDDDETPITPDFELEELDSDESDDEGIEVVRPDHFEDARSEKSVVTALEEEDGVTNKLRDLQVSEGSADELEPGQLRCLRKKKRRGAGIFKRTHAQSVEGDSSYSDDDPLDDNDPTARRLRRRVRGPVPHDRRGSLMFEDKGYPNINNIEEVEEPEEGVIVHTKGPPSIPSDDAFTLDELPFWGGTDEFMDVGFGSS